MKFTDRVKNAVTAFSNQTEEKATNSSRGLAADYLRNGNKHQPLLQDWSQVEMSDQDMYTGYSYAAINKRANRASVLGKKFLMTEASSGVMESAKEKGEEVKHPYLGLIKKSKEFSERQFWNEISTYLDLEGVYYLMAVRAIGDATNADGTKKVGEVQKFQLLNPYQVKRVRKDATMEIGGYIESKDGMYREIPKEMIIEIRLLNPFDKEIPFSMTDAAKENQFTLKQAGDYTRHSIKGNINAPGAITTDVVLEDNIFDNFVSRIKNHSKGEPLYGNGAGAINWNAMQVDLDKASLDKINEIHRSTLFAVSGTSKTVLGIEESGTTRETSKTQNDNFTEDAIMPQVEDIIDAMNLDYRRYYSEWEKEEYEIVLDNPLESDRESELKDLEIREKEFDIRDKLVAKGYEYDVAAKFAHGDISIEELGEPTLEEAISEQEAESIAMKELGMEADTLDSEPEDGNEVDEMQDNKQKNELATNAYTDAKFVPKEENERRLKLAVKRVKQKMRDAKEAKKLQKQADKEAKLAEKAKKSEKKADEIVEELGTKTEEQPIPTVKVEVVTPQNSITEAFKYINQISSKDFPEIYEDLGIDFDNLGCIMMNTNKIPVAQYIKKPEEDLFVKEGWGGGLAGENSAHVTLLFGLLENGNEWKNKVDTLLVDWKMDTVTIEEVSYFDLGDSYAIVGLLEKTNEIVDGHERLTLLPHINTFSEYHPHITLAYIKKDVELDKWIKPLAKKYNGQKVATTGINYGDTKEEKAKNHVEDEHDMTNLPRITDEEMAKAGFIQDEKGAWIKGPNYVEKLPQDTKEEEPVEKAVEKSENDAPDAHTAHQTHVHIENEYIVNSTYLKAKNALNEASRETVTLQESNLYTATADLEKEIALAIINAFYEGRTIDAQRLLTEAQEKQYEDELSLLLAGYFLILFPIYAKQLMNARAGEYDTQGIFAMTDDIEAYIKKYSRQAAESHVNTVVEDFTQSVDKVFNQNIEDELINIVEAGMRAQDSAILAKLPKNANREDIVKAVKQGRFDNDPAYKTARDLARQGKGLESITREIQKEYQNISKNRARTIARHETNRVFNMAQYQADVQFLTESNLMSNAFKILRNRADDPCPFCAKLIEESRRNPIPFQENFAELDSEITTTYTKKNGSMGVRKLPISYEPITAGNVHVNCRCEYELLIIKDDGTVLNDLRTAVDKNYSEAQPRDKSGKWKATGVKKTVLSGMVKPAKENGGMTTNVAGDSPTEGIAFAPRKDTERIISSKDFDETTLNNFVDEHFATLQQEGMHIGGWFNEDDGNWYLDISKVGGYNKNVIQEAQNAEQLAVFDLKTFKEIKTGDIVNGQYKKSGTAEAIFSQAFEGRDESSVQRETKETNASTNKELAENYNPSQPRDDSGRWSGGGGSGASSASSAKGGDTVPVAQGRSEKDVRADAEFMVEAMKPDDEYLASKIGAIGSDLGLTAKKGPLKEVDRITQKAIEEEGGDVFGMKDVVRATVIVNNYSEMQNVVSRIGQDFEIVRVKELSAGGYRDVKVNIALPNSGFAGEVIVIAPEFYNAKANPTLFKESGHDFYKIIRSAKTTKQSKQIAIEKSELIYGEAEKQYLLRTASNKTLTVDL